MVIKLLLILFFFPSQLLNPLLRLRQACCHPQAVRGGYLSVQKRYMLLLRDSCYLKTYKLHVTYNRYLQY